jgi:alpha-ketoglutarate-dependent taurine dioxygenase
MLNQPIRDARAWRGDSLDDRQAWYYPLSPRCRAALEETLRRLRRQPRSVTTLRAEDEPCAICADELAPVRDALENGRGFAILKGPAGAAYSPGDRTAAYWLVGQLLGRPLEQNVQGVLLYDVRDTGNEVRYGARFSVTNAESSFHTDNSFGDSIVDYVGLLCIHPARSGGFSQVISGYSVHNELLARRREQLETLYQAFPIDRRGGVRPGEAATVQYPVLSWDGGDLTYRYLRYWIESGYEKLGQVLPEERRQALDALDAAANDPALRVEFALEPGDMFFVNNRWILHNRTAFEDFVEEERRRHLVRLWLRRDPSRDR